MLSIFHCLELDWWFSANVGRFSSLVLVDLPLRSVDVCPPVKKEIRVVGISTVLIESPLHCCFGLHDLLSYYAFELQVRYARHRRDGSLSEAVPASLSGLHLGSSGRHTCL